MSDIIHQCRNIISRMNQNLVTRLSKIINDNISDAKGLQKYCLLMLKDLCNHFRTRNLDYKTYFNNKFKLGKTRNTDINSGDFVSIKFISKDLDKIDFSKLFNDPVIHKLFPSKKLSAKYSKDTFSFSCSFKQSKSIRHSICNYRPSILEYDNNSILNNDNINTSNDSNISCNCHLYSEFIDNDVGHVITGDVNIVKNKKLRNLFKKGYNYIESTFRNKAEIIKSLNIDVSNYICKISNKFSINVRFFDEWKDALFRKVSSIVNSLKLSNRRSVTIIKSESNDLNKLKEHFIMTGVDKAKNNISFICKKYYLNKIKSELESTSTYVSCDRSEEDIVKDHIRFCSKFDIDIKDRLLPFIHMVPKFHKRTIDFRYIAAGIKSSTKTLSKILSGVFSLVDKTIMRMDNYKFKFKGSSGYWIVKNKEAVTSKLNYLNNMRYARSVSSFDFKKLYTNLPNDKVIEKITDLVNRSFLDKKVEYISVNDKYKASWSAKKKGKWSLTIDNIIEMFKFLMNNIFVKFGRKIYQQVIGIPMGCDCAPKIADLFLYWYEHNYISEAVDNPNLQAIVHILKYCSRYIDDLNIPNANQEICRIICNDIYPEELSLECTNDSSNRSSFLDLDILVKKEGFATKLYDKRRDFSFNVVTFPNLRSNIPNSQAYGSFTGELYRLCKSSTCFADFKDEVRMLMKKLKNQNFDVNELKKRICNVIKSKPACFHKFCKNVKLEDFI